MLTQLSKIFIFVESNTLKHLNELCSMTIKQNKLNKLNFTYLYSSLNLNLDKSIKQYGNKC